MTPTVCCVMLVNGREAMVRRAIACFRAQTYERKKLLIWDSSPGLTTDHENFADNIRHMPAPVPVKSTIGALRNEANAYALEYSVDLIAHWDSDDWSHPRRLEEQVALLEASGKRLVGYRGLLFWDSRIVQKPHGENKIFPPAARNEAWIYAHPDARWCAGASFTYHRELWERFPFDDAPHEDQRWWMRPEVNRESIGVLSILQRTGPRMICQIHGENSEVYKRDAMLAGKMVWRRAAEFDSYCAERMNL